MNRVGKPAPWRTPVVSRAIPLAYIALVCAWSPATTRSQPFTDVTPTSWSLLTQREDNASASCGNTHDCQVWFTGGAAVGDYDGDGDPDVFYPRLGPPDVLFENQGDGTFVDVADEVGLSGPSNSNGAAFVDVDNDGDLDLVVTRVHRGHTALFISDGSSRTGTRPFFRDEASERGILAALPEVGAGGSIALGDFDRDGWPDLYITEWAGPVSSCGAEQSRLLWNMGGTLPGHFLDRTRRAGVTASRIDRLEAWTFSAAFHDLDGDGFQDLALASDYGTSRLFWNLGDGTFADGTSASGVGTDRSGMGSAFADVDRDGDIDWFVSAIFAEGTTALGPGWPETDGNRLYRNDGGRLFEDITDSARVRDSGWGWGSTFFDVDHDGDHDLAIANGVDLPPFNSESNRFLLQRTQLSFESLGPEVGFSDTQLGRAVVTLDFDQDGDMDVFLTRNGSTPLLLRNDGGAMLGDWIQVRLEGSVGTRDAFGAVVRLIEVGGDINHIELADSNTHFLGHSERVAHFGLGPAFSERGTRLSILVEFLSGHIVAVHNVAPNTAIVIREPSSPAPRGPSTTPNPGSCDTGSRACAVDCDGNELDDDCEIAASPAFDCNANRVLDSCEIRLGFAEDCDRSQRIDTCDIASNASLDRDDDGHIDECVAADGGHHVEGGHDAGTAPSPRPSHSCAAAIGARVGVALPAFALFLFGRVVTRAFRASCRVARKSRASSTTQKITAPLGE